MRNSLISLLCLFLLLSACGLQREEQSSPEQTGQKQAVQKQDSQSKQGKENGGKNNGKGTSPGEVKLDIAQEANDLALTVKGVQHASSVVLDKELSLAVEIGQMQRWNLENIRKQIFHGLRDKFPDLEIHVSTDRKILWELQRLERDMYASNPDVEAIQKKMKKINEDMKG